MVAVQVSACWQAALPAHKDEPAFLTFNGNTLGMKSQAMQSAMQSQVPSRATWQPVAGFADVMGAECARHYAPAFLPPGLSLLEQAKPKSDAKVDRDVKADETSYDTGSTRASDSISDSQDQDPQCRKKKLRICKAKRDRYRKLVEQGVQKVRADPTYNLRNMKLPNPIAMNPEAFQKFATTINMLAQREPIATTGLQ